MENMIGVTCTLISNLEPRIDGYRIVACET